MGTHPIFESDFDCLTETERERGTMSIAVFEEPFLNRFSKKQEIARGLRGVIRCVVDENGKTYAAKTIRKTQKGQSVMDEINAEIKALEICAPLETVIKLHSVFKTNRDYTLILDFLPRDLHTEIEKDEQLREADVAKIIYALLKTVKFLHERSIIHLDIKPENILLDGQNAIRLCDFGMSKFLDEEKSDICQIAGTTEYCAPEQIQFDPLTPAADMWSIGCCTFVLLSKTSPFRRDALHETQSAVIQADFDFDDEVWKSRSAESKDFITKLLQKSPKDRGTADEMMNHEWLQKMNRINNRRMSKRTSSVALGIESSTDVNLNLSGCSTDGSLPSGNIADSEEMDAPDNPPKKARPE